MDEMLMIEPPPALVGGRVGVVGRPDLRHDLPQARLLVCDRRSGCGRKAVGEHLHLDIGMHGEVSVPAGVVGRAALRGDHDGVVAHRAVDQRVGLWSPRPATLHGENETRRAVPEVPLGSVRREVALDVLVTDQCNVGLAVDGRIRVRHFDTSCL